MLEIEKNSSSFSNRWIFLIGIISSGEKSFDGQAVTAVSLVCSPMVRAFSSENTAAANKSDDQGAGS